MPRAKRRGSCGCCTVEALISVDERGQMVLPKEVRERLGLRGGDKLALATIERDGAVCCLVLTKAAALAAAVRSALGPVADGLLADASP
jgi:AbrB family looped-hinge helix DNA binding protein